jgi:ubiquinone/menaquinone biosynthesis C-methylase UbiE
MSLPEPPPTSNAEAEAVQRFYRFHSLIYDWTRWPVLVGRRRAVELLALRPGDSVLEIGCGTGLTFPPLQTHLDPERGRIVGVDFSAAMLRQAGRRVAARGWRNVELVLADATTLRLEREFDAVIFAFSLTLIPDFEGALCRAVEHLRAGGRLVVHDFSTFAAWGPVGVVPRAWLRMCHVRVDRPYIAVVERLCTGTSVCHGAGGYTFTLVAGKA